MSSGEFQLVLLICFVLSFVSCWNLKCRDHLCKNKVKSPICFHPGLSQAIK